MYQVGDRVVYPMYGAGVIQSIEDREMLGKTQAYYVLHMPIGDMQVMVPVMQTQQAGLRPVITKEQALDVLLDFEQMQVAMDQNWNKRYRENLLRIKSGDTKQTTEVVKGLMLRERERALSTGERKMLLMAKNILFSELMFSLGFSRSELEEQVEQRVFLQI